MIKKGVYAAGLSVLNKDLSVNIDATINHAEGLIQNGLHGKSSSGEVLASPNW